MKCFSGFILTIVLSASLSVAASSIPIKFERSESKTHTHSIKLLSRSEIDLHVLFIDNSTDEPLEETILPSRGLQDVILPIYSDVKVIVSRLDNLQKLYSRIIPAVNLFAIKSIEIKEAGAELTYDKDALVDYVRKEYHILQSDDCQVWLSKEKKELPNNPKQVACTVVGSKPVYKGLYSEIDAINPLLKILMFCPDSPVGYFTVKGFDDFLYVFKKGYEKEAYLLALYDLQNPIRYHALDENPYLIGYLLGYPESGIRFYFMLVSFHENRIKAHQARSYENPGYYHEWPEDLKKQFEEYEQTVQAGSQYNKEKLDAIEWLHNNMKKTVEELKREIHYLEENFSKRFPSEKYKIH